MPQRVRATACPTCGHANDGGAVKEFEIAEIPVLDPVSFEQSLGKLAEAVKGGHSAVLAKLEEIRVPAVLKSTCEEHPELCQHQAQIDQLTHQLQERNAAHDVLSPEHLETQYDSCPNCKQGLDTWFESQVTKRGYKKAEPTPTPVSEKAKVLVDAYGMSLK